MQGNESNSARGGAFGLSAAASNKALGALEDEKNLLNGSLQTSSTSLQTTTDATLLMIMPAAAPAAASPGNGDDVIWGTPDPDVLRGHGGDDILHGLGDDDKLYGGQGDDVLYGYGGSDLLSGGQGDDILMYSSDGIWPAGFGVWNVGSPGNVINGTIVAIRDYNRSYDGFDGGQGEDTILMTSGDDVLVLGDKTSPNAFGENKARIVDVEIIDAGDGNDAVDLTSKDFIYGDVTIYGGNGNDYLWSSAGDDVIYGGAGDDHIDGGVGDDILVFGEGADKVYGREGEDLFVYDTFDNAVDRIYAFETGVDGDVLNLTDILVGYDSLTDDINNFVSLFQTPKHTALNVNVDGDAGGAFTRLVYFDGGISETVTDLVNNGNLVLDQTAVI